MNSWIIRKATPKDIPGLADVHLNSWLSTYRGIVPDHYLDSLNLDSRIELWTRVFASDNGSATFVLVSPSGRISGFINGGPSREKDLDIEAEVYSLYLLQEAQGRGYGRELMTRMIGYFRDKGYRTMLVWVLEENPSVKFYEKMGGRFFMKNQLQIGGEYVQELCLAWDDLESN